MRRKTLVVSARKRFDKMIMASFWSLRYPQLATAFRIWSHLTKQEMLVLYRLASSLPQCNILEIGSYLGASACCFAAGLKKTGSSGHVYCIDTWKNDAMSEGSRDTMAEFVANTMKFSRWIVPIRGWSTQVVAAVSDYVQKIDLLFVDGDHSYETCLADWQAFSPFLSKRGIVVMHDVGWAEGVQRVVEEEISPLVIGERCLPNMWWGWIEQ
jgi:predicted O-methyltransferase YrrM